MKGEVLAPLDLPLLLARLEVLQREMDLLKAFYRDHGAVRQEG